VSPSIRSTLFAASLAALAALAGLAGLAASCATAPVAQAPCPLPATVSLHEVGCATCARRALERARALPGVRTVELDPVAVELNVCSDADGPDAAAVAALLAADGAPAVAGPGAGRYYDGVRFPPGADVAEVEPGPGAALDDLAEPGRVTVVDFHASWCGACRDVELELALLLGRGAGFRLRRVRVESWESPATRALLDGVAELPYVVVFDAGGRRVGAVSGLDLARLAALLAQAAGPPAP
jgi:thiol-disulfide isomerase/thioredoxin